ncbi:FeoA family protein [Fodinibius salsisoli]|uniref:Ferrous iron transport protein A n=1 Tax=Fodinibius salsisoli TaxID=2820877 RepID=A0ABT3PRV7_9BACT|nr:FeoA family protein [Fodinibius salsisoli]MCW9708571.1 ferrous iron transport protein A [Fodinibius salsisoli]
MSILLSEQKQNGKKTIADVTGPKAARLLEMGLLPGTTVEVIRSAPLGFPIEIKVRGYLLTLRKEEAECIEIE